MKKTLLLGAMALPAAIGSMSQPTVAVAQSAASNWAGAYVGANAGGAWGTSAQHDDGLPTTICTIGTCVPADGRYHISGPVAGGGFGYNWQNGPWVAGLETDLSWADVRGHGTCLPAPGHDCGTKVESLGTVRARLGMAFGGSPAYSGMPTKVAPVANRGTLLYLTGGFAYGDVHAWDALTPASGSKTLTGWTAGAGVEWALQGNWSAKLEYLYVDLRKKDLFDVVPGVPEFVNAKVNVVRFGLNYKFDSSSSWGKGPISSKY